MAYMSDRLSAPGKHEVVNDRVSSKYGFPLKVVFVKENDNIVVITAYPLRKRLRS